MLDTQHWPIIISVCSDFIIPPLRHHRQAACGQLSHTIISSSPIITSTQTVQILRKLNSSLQQQSKLYFSEEGSCLGILLSSLSGCFAPSWWSDNCFYCFPLTPVNIIIFSSETTCGFLFEQPGSRLRQHWPWCRVIMWEGQIRAQPVNGFWLLADGADLLSWSSNISILWLLLMYNVILLNHHVKWTLAIDHRCFINFQNNKFATWAQNCKASYIK